MAKHEQNGPDRSRCRCSGMCASFRERVAEAPALLLDLRRHPHAGRGIRAFLASRSMNPSRPSRATVRGAARDQPQSPEGARKFLVWLTRCSPKPGYDSAHDFRGKAFLPTWTRRPCRDDEGAAFFHRGAGHRCRLARCARCHDRLTEDPPRRSCRTKPLKMGRGCPLHRGMNPCRSRLADADQARSPVVLRLASSCSGKPPASASSS